MQRLWIGWRGFIWVLLPVLASCGTEPVSAGPVSNPRGVYCVALWGDDDNPGTEELPWRTIHKAATTLTAGDSVHIRTGTYYERVIPQNSGSAGNRITYLAYPGDSPSVDGSGITLPYDWGGLFDISERSHIRLDGLKVKNAGPNDNNVGILVDSSNHIEILNCSLYNTVSSGIGVWSSRNVTIAGNTVELACNDGEQECITVATTDTFVIANNHVFNSGPGSMGGEGIDAKDGSKHGSVYGNHVHAVNRLGIYVDAWDKHTHDIAVHANLVYDNASDGIVLASEAGGLLENVLVYNNVLYDNDDVGIVLAGWGEPSPSRPMRDILVINNTIYHNGTGGWGGGISVDNEDTERLTIRNNIVSQNHMFQILIEYPVVDLSVDHNLVDGYQGYPGEVYGTDYVTGDPLFIDISAADFHLLSDSPAVDSGSSVSAPASDFDGAQRPQGSGYDIGAFEVPCFAFTWGDR